MELIPGAVAAGIDGFVETHVQRGSLGDYGAGCNRLRILALRCIV
jgi:hypothetical protein